VWELTGDNFGKRREVDGEQRVPGLLLCWWDLREKVRMVVLPWGEGDDEMKEKTCIILVLFPEMGSVEKKKKLKDEEEESPWIHEKQGSCGSVQREEI